MSLLQWKNNGWLKPHTAKKSDITQLFAVIERDLRVSAHPEMDADWRFVAGYNAALQTATIALHASGFEATKGGGAHFYVIESLRFTVSASREDIDLFQAFRSKRGGSIYESTGIATETEIIEIHQFALQLRDRVCAWLKASQPELL